MAKSKEDNAPQSSAPEFANSSRIDLVKELIFGEDLASTRRSIQELESKLETASESLTETLEQRLQALEQRFTERMLALESKTQAELERLSNEKTDRVSLGRMLEEIGKNLQSEA